MVFWCFITNCSQCGLESMFWKKKLRTWNWEVPSSEIRSWLCYQMSRPASNKSFSVFLFVSFVFQNSFFVLSKTGWCFGLKLRAPRSTNGSMAFGTCPQIKAWFRMGSRMSHGNLDLVGLQYNIHICHNIELDRCWVEYCILYVLYWYVVGMYMSMCSYIDIYIYVVIDSDIVFKTTIP